MLIDFSLVSDKVDLVHIIYGKERGFYILRPKFMSFVKKHDINMIMMDNNHNYFVIRDKKHIALILMRFQ